MKLAVPLVNGDFSPHFGGADSFALFEVDDASREIVARSTEPTPPHERGAFPVWLRAQGVTAVLAGGMGPRAVDMLEQYGIAVITGVPEQDPESLVTSYLQGILQSVGSTCEGHGLHHCGDHDDPTHGGTP
jgi:ATP-binding protein involved in chromosome partitioning